MADRGDVVALEKDLRDRFGDRVRTAVVHNGAHAHDATSYLTDTLTGVETLTDGLRLLPVEAALDYRNAALTYRAARRRGVTVRTLFDCLIATVAARTGATLVHRDRDFDALTDALPDLRVRSLI